MTHPAATITDVNKPRGNRNEKRCVVSNVGSPTPSGVSSRSMFSSNPNTKTRSGRSGPRLGVTAPNICRRRPFEPTVYECSHDQPPSLELGFGVWPHRITSIEAKAGHPGKEGLVFQARLTSIIQVTFRLRRRCRTVEEIS